MSDKNENIELTPPELCLKAQTASESTLLENWKYRMRFLTALLVILFTCWCSGQAQYPRPRRPERFDTAEQISNYLKELQEYYSVHGRGRYGKRQMHIADASVIFRETPFLEKPFLDQATGEDQVFKNFGYK